MVQQSATAQPHRRARRSRSVRSVGGAHRTASSIAVGRRCRSAVGLLGPVAGQAQEHVVQGRPAQADVLDRARRSAWSRLATVVSAATRSATGAVHACAALDEHLGLAGGHAGERLSDQRPGRRRSRPRPRSGRRRPALQLGRGAGRRSARPWSMTVIRSASWSASSRYCVVSSTVVPPRDQAADRVPDLVPAARVEAGGRLVEEQHLRRQDHARRPGRAGGACRRCSSSRPCRRRRPGRTAPAARRPAASAARRAEVEQPAEQLEVLPAGEDLVDRGVLAGEADPAAYLLRVARRRRRPATSPCRRRPRAGW